jgi:hypothetical protein
LTKDDQPPSLIRHVGSVVQKGLGGWEWDGVRLAIGIGEGDADEWDELCGEAGLEFVQLKSGQSEKNEFGGMIDALFIFFSQPSIHYTCKHGTDPDGKISY